MLIEIESFYGDKLLFGKHMKVSEIKARMKEILVEIGAKDFASVFCARCGYEEIPYCPDQEVDYVIDLDIGKVYKPWRE